MDETVLARIKIVLVRPLGALNVGSVARVMKNMGLTQLVLVEPQCEPLGEEGRKMALHALDVLEAARIVESIPEALVGCQRAIATSARSRHLSVEPENPRIALPWLFGAESSALIFGPEDKGLSNEDLKYAQRFVRIPSSPAYSSLNLAQAVAVCCYELYQNCLENPEVATPELAEKTDRETTAPIDALEGYYQQLESLLLKIGYLYPHTAESRMTKFRLLFNRAQPSANEVAMLKGIIRQMEWALSQNR
jgi:tRNA/rRNA methyltransferase